MSIEPTLVTETNNNTAAAVVAGIEIAGPQPLDDGGWFFTQLVPAGAKVEVFDLAALEEKLAPHPRRKTGTVHVQDAVSFIGYLDKHGLPCTEVYADPARLALVGVVNAHAESVPSENVESDAGHGDHRVNLDLVLTDGWKAWTRLDKTWLDQLAFAEHLEDNGVYISSPDAATMLEIATSIQGTTEADFKRAERLSDGQVQFRYEETQTARAGQVGELEIPAVFILSLRPFEGSDEVEVTARFRYRINGGNLKLSYALLNPTEIARQAFLDHVDAVRSHVTCPVFQGRPE